MSNSQIINCQSFDGYTFQGKLDLPEKKYTKNQDIQKLIVFINGSGPNTYDNRRFSPNMNYNYFDLFAEKLTEQGSAFFRYNTRGVTPGTLAPLFAEIDEKEYANYLPSVEIQDIEYAIRQLKKMPELANTKIYLLGWSCGTILAPIIAQRANVEISGLLLVSYCNDKMEEILDWQLNGQGSMVFYRRYFDYDSKGYITKEDFLADRYHIKDMVEADFEDLDINNDQKLDSLDFNIMLHDHREKVFQAIANNDNQWLKNNYPVLLTAQWFKEYQKLEPNRHLLPTLDIPIHIFHSIYDNSAPVEGVYNIEDRFVMAKKDNLHTYIFDGHDQDLNYALYPLYGKLSTGMSKLFQVCGEIS